MSRLPIRLRLTVAFAVAMAFVLALTGAFVYTRVASSLDESVDELLEARLIDFGARVAEGGTDFDLGGRTALVDPEERFAQLLDDRTGTVVDGTSQVGAVRLLRAAELARARGGVAVRRDVSEVPGLAGRVRILATGVGTPDGRRILVVGASLEDRDETLGQLLFLLAVVGPVALLLTSLLGYALATAALRPVDAMRREAASISAQEPERRLPLPASRDEIRRLGETLNDMLDRLGSALERERRFVGDASHELRTPLANLKAELELALARPRSPEEVDAALRSAAVETDRLVRLAEDLLLVSRADHGRLPVRREIVSARALLAGVEARFAGRMGGGRAIELACPDSLTFSGDPARLAQALGNLVENALRYGDGTIRIEVTARNGRVELHVTDEGPGFPPEFVPLAFERFARHDEARSGGGTGLGLAIVAAVAHAHGGTASAANLEGGGADVWLSLPRENGGDAPRRDREDVD